MKKIALIMMLSAMSTYGVFADSSLDIKGGIAHIDGINASNKIGADFAIGLNFGIDKYLEIGPEVGLTYRSFSTTVASTTTGNAATTVTVSNDMFLVPTQFVGRLRAPMGPIMPYFSAGIGYMFLTQSASGTSNSFGGMVVTPAIGFVYSLGGSTDDIWSTGASSQLGLLVEVGYRWSEPEKDGVQVSASGIVARGGVRWNF